MRIAKHPLRTAISPPLSETPRERAIGLVCAGTAVAFGALSALGADQAIATTLVVGAFGVAALILPLSWVALGLAALIPLQIYFPFAGALNLRGALVFSSAAALRVFVTLLARSSRQSMLGSLRSLPWLIPAALFVFAALAAVPTALNRYEALKGIYLWLPVFAVAFVFGEIVRSEWLVERIIVALIAAGVGEAALGSIQTLLDAPRVIGILQLPISSLVYQPNLLRDRLADLSFNWLFNQRVLAFGTFINNIDYAIFLAAILTLVLAQLLGESPTTTARSTPYAIRHTLVLAVCAIVLAVALMQTIKWSGILALAGGVGTIVLLSSRRLSSRLVWLGALGGAAALAIAALFSGDIASRVLFLVQREGGAFSTAGRVTTWLHLLGFLAQRPLFGFGLNNAPFLLDASPSLSGGAFVLNLSGPESAYVAILAETGIAGFAMLAVFFAVILTRAYRNLQSTQWTARAIGLGSAVVAILFGNLTVVGLTTDQNGMLLGALIGLIFGTRSTNPQ
jgi:large-conductance mechanosensitive channel